MKPNAGSQFSQSTVRLPTPTLPKPWKSNCSLNLTIQSLSLDWLRFMSAMARLTKCSMPMKRSEEHTSELQSQFHLVCRLLLEKKKHKKNKIQYNDKHQQS